MCKGGNGVDRKVPSGNGVISKYSMNKGIRGESLEVESELL